MSGRILVLNAGSSSLKFAAYDAGGATCAMRGALSGIGHGQPRIAVEGDGAAWSVPPCLPQADLAVWLLEILAQRVGPVAAIGHRIVHGGTRHPPRWRSTTR